MFHSQHRTATADSGRLQGLEALYRDLHAHPELSGKEARTASIFADALQRRGAEVTTGVGGLGVIGIVRNGLGPTVMMRAELDALPVFEKTTLPYASTRPGIMHACGHDLHLVGVVGAIEELMRLRTSWSGTVLVVGQPAEETLTGAARLAEDGLFERWPRPDVALAQHIAPFPVGVVAHGPSLTKASVQFRVELRGESMHAALAPWAPDVVGALSRVAAHVSDAATAGGALAAIGAIHSGDAANTVPNSAIVLGSVRAAQLATADAVVADLAARLKSLAPVRAEVTVTGSAPAVEPDTELLADLTAEHARAFGRSRVLTGYVTNAADDFSRYGIVDRDGSRIRLGYWMVGGVDAASWRTATRAGLSDPAVPERIPPIPGNHSDRFAPHLSALRVAVVAMSTAARSQLAAASTTERTQQ